MKRNLVLALGLTFLFSLAAHQECLADSEPWQAANGPYGGSVAALVMAPGYVGDHTVFAGLRGQGVYRTNDSGNSWQRVSPSGWVVTALAISPAFTTDRTLLAAVGLPTTGMQVYHSTDAGQSWQAPTTTPYPNGFPNVLGLAISPNFLADHTVYVLGGSQTYTSTDGGLTFAQASGWFASHQVLSLAFSPAFATDRTLFALVQNEGLYKSSDGAATWGLTGLSGTLSTFAVSSDYAHDQMLAATSLSTGQVFTSTDGGGSWLTNTLTLSVGGPHIVLFSPTFAADRIMLAASSTDPGAYRSTDGGATWSPVGWYSPTQPYYGGFIGGSVSALTLAPHTSTDATALAGTSSGLYRSSNWGEHWYQRSNGLARLTVRSIAFAPSDPATLLAGTSFFEHLHVDAAPVELEGNLQLSTDGGQQWQDVSGRLDRVQSVAFSPSFAADKIAFACTGALGQHGFAEGGVYRSTNGGHDWTAVFGGRVCEALAVSPGFSTDHTLWASMASYTASLGLYVSNDGGDHWILLAPSVRGQVIAPSPNYAVDHTLFIGAGDSGVKKSSDGGAHWTLVLTQPVTALAVSPAYAASRTLYAAVKGNASAPGAVYRSTDGGANWQLLDTGIPATSGSLSVTIAVLTFSADGSVLAGVLYGNEGGGGAVYRSTDGGGTWQAVGSGLSAYNVFTLASAPSQSLIFYAGSDGGLWQIETSQGGSAEPGVWVTGGPRGGRANALAVSPNFANDGLALSGEWMQGRYGSQSGLGIFKSTDGGQTWRPVISDAAVYAFAFSPGFVADQTVFAGTGGGLFKSSDGGESWQGVPNAYAGTPGSISGIALSPNYTTSGHMLAASTYGALYMSRDGGLSWTYVYSVSAFSTPTYSPDFASDGIAFVSGFGLWKTTDGGTSWTQVMTQSVGQVTISPQFGDDHTLFVSAGDLLISHDGGTSWISVTVAAGASVGAPAISPAFDTDHTLFASVDSGLYRSSDGGLSWNPVASYPGVPVLSLALSPGWPAHPVLLVGTSQGVYRTMDGGATWALSPGMAALSTLPLALASDERLLLTGALNHGVYASTNGGAAWFPAGLQAGTWHYDIADVAISPAYASDHTLFAAWRNGAGIGSSYYRTTDGGATWQRVYSTDYVGTLAISPQYASDHTVYATAHSGRVARSTDGGDHWTEVGTWPSGSSSPGVTQVALPPNYPADSTVLAAGNSGFLRLLPGTTTWELAASGLTTGTSVVGMAVSPNYAADHTLLATAGWSEGSMPHHGVFRSTDGGVNWQLANTGLPDTWIRYVAFSPNYATDHTAYVTFESLLYRSVDGGLRWTAIGAPPGLPYLSRLVVNRAGDVYVASGSGIRRYTTPAQDILINGGFEADSGWDMPQTPWPAGYSDCVAYAGRRSIRVGVDDGNVVSPAYSSARQTVTIPADAISATLSFYVYPISGESVAAAPSRVLGQEMDAGMPSPLGMSAGDAQYALIIPQTGSTLIPRTLFWGLSNAQAWQPYTFDLTSYAGQTLLLHLGVYNDGAGDQTGMYVDGASLVVKRAGAEAHSLYLPLIFKD